MPVTRIPSLHRLSPRAVTPGSKPKSAKSAKSKPLPKPARKPANSPALKKSPKSAKSAKSPKSPKQPIKKSLKSPKPAKSAKSSKTPKSLKSAKSLKSPSKSLKPRPMTRKSLRGGTTDCSAVVTQLTSSTPVQDWGATGSMVPIVFGAPGGTQQFNSTGMFATSLAQPGNLLTPYNAA